MRGFWILSLTVTAAAVSFGCFSSSNGDGLNSVGIDGHTSTDGSSDGTSNGTDDGGLGAYGDASFDAAITGNQAGDAACVLAPVATQPDNASCNQCLQHSCCAQTNGCLNEDDAGLSSECQSLAICVAGCINGQSPDGGIFTPGNPDSGPVVKCDTACEALFTYEANQAYAAYMSCYNSSGCATACSQ